MSNSYGEKPDIYYARVFSWMRGRGIRLDSGQKQFLAGYESKYGKVPAKTLNEWSLIGY